MLTVTYYVVFKIHNVVYILSVYWHSIYFFTALVNSVSLALYRICSLCIDNPAWKLSRVSSGINANNDGLFLNLVAAYG
uniref:Uncharacterized protein n=1 Tax=Rhipicephalus microplus TaxID=6941 RepID=A0A6M2DEF8_RHIMP